MGERVSPIVILSISLLGACGDSTDSDGVDPAADAASNASNDSGGAVADGSPIAIDGGDASAAASETGADAGAPSVASPCFHNPGPEAWVCNADGVTLARTKAGATETLRCAHGCVALPDGFDSQCRPRDGALGDTVNGHAMTAQQASWVSYFAWCAVPLLQGTRDARLTSASTVAWWALKEGVLDVANPNPVGYSWCGAGGDHDIGPLETCAAGSAWQVGASGIQAPCCSSSNVENTAAMLFPSMSDSELLSGAAVEAGYAIGSANNTGIASSTDVLKTSWLLHVTAIGFTYQAPIVTNECITASDSWCFGTGWTTSANYAPDKASAMQSMSDLRAILDLLSP
jgi:hypothetical protein